MLWLFWRSIFICLAPTLINADTHSWPALHHPVRATVNIWARHHFGVGKILALAVREGYHIISGCIHHLNTEYLKRVLMAPATGHTTITVQKHSPPKTEQKRTNESNYSVHSQSWQNYVFSSLKFACSLKYEHIRETTMLT